MDKKKIIIIIAISVLVLAAAILAIFSRNKATNKQQPGTTQQGAPVTNTPVSSQSFPASSTSDTFITKEQPNTNLESINNPGSKTEMQDAYNKFSSIAPEKFKWTDFVDSNKKSIGLNDFSQASGLKIKPELYALLDTSKFDLFSCPLTNGNKNLGVSLNIKLLPNYKGNLYQDEIRIMKDWESTLFKDTRTILFPGINFTSQQLEQKPEFKDGQFRYAEISMPDNKQGSINYNIIDDYVLISNSFGCLKKASDEIISPSN